MFISDVPWLSVWIVKFFLVVLLDCKISWIVFLKCQINGCLLEWLDSSIIFLGRWGSLRSWPSAGDVERQGWIWNFIVTMILTVRIDIKRTEQLETRNLGCTQYIGILIDWLMVSYEHVSDIGGLLTVFGAIQIRNNVNVLFADIAARRVMQKIGKTTNTIAITLRWIVDNINALYHQLTLQKENLKILNSFSQVRNFQRQSRPAAAVAKLIDKKVVITKYFVKNTW